MLHCGFVQVLEVPHAQLEMAMAKYRGLQLVVHGKEQIGSGSQVLN